MIVAIIDVGVGYVCDNLLTHAKGGITRQTNDLLMVDNHDVLILGSSRAKHHYDTRFLSDTLGLDVYNAGFDGKGVVLAYGILGMVLERYQPKLIVYDVEPSFDIYEYAADNNHKRYIADLKPYYHHRIVESIIKDVSIEEWNMIQLSMIRYNTTIISFAIDNIQTRETFPYGYEPLHGEMSKQGKDESNDSLYEDWFKLKYVSRLIQLSQSNNVPIIVCASPMYGAQTSNLLQPIKEICNQYGVTFYDNYANPNYTSHREWFKDKSHLNALGAKIYSRHIAEQIIDTMNIHQITNN